MGMKVKDNYSLSEDSSAQRQGETPVELNSSSKYKRPEAFRKKRKCCICMVSDFFYPNMGGIEMHIFELSKHLIKRGFKVIIVTHSYGNRHGIRWMANGIKVYYLPYHPFFDVVLFPSVYGSLPLCRNIILREKVDIVHGHQATSTLANEFIMHAKSLGVKTVYTDHSLFNFSDDGCIHINKILKYSIQDVNHSICVSHTSRENLVLRTEINPYETSVIGNAVDTNKFIPQIDRRPPPPTINIVVISRLTYRKGIDLIVQVIPRVCKKFPFINFIIGGEGPKRTILEEMREKHRLHNSVVLLGKIQHENVKDVLQQGHIFLNSSLTEAFCIAIIEAASCGLLVVSTDVGGIPEVLPSDMMILSKPNYKDMCDAIEKALHMIHEVDSNSFHERLRKMYSWEKVAEKTEKVYMNVLSQPNPTILNRIRKVYSVSKVYSKIHVCLIILNYFLCQLLEFFKPQKEIEEAISFPHLTELD